MPAIGNRNAVGPRKNGSDTWTEERLVVLHQMVADGHSGPEIAAALGNGISSNSVKNKIQRLRTVAQELGPEPIWTNGRVDLLRQLWLDGRSASEISAKIGVARITRSAVLGKVHRLGLAGRPKGQNQRTIGCPRVERRAPPRRAVITVSPPRTERSAATNDALGELATAAAEAIRIAPAPVFECEPVSFFDLTDSQCKWPNGDPSDFEALRFCGAAKGPLGPYCQFHSSLGINSAETRRIVKQQGKYLR